MGVLYGSVWSEHYSLYCLVFLPVIGAFYLLGHGSYRNHPDVRQSV